MRKIKITIIILLALGWSFLIGWNYYAHFRKVVQDGTITKIEKNEIGYKITVKYDAGKVVDENVDNEIFIKENFKVGNRVNIPVPKMTVEYLDNDFLMGLYWTLAIISIIIGAIFFIIVLGLIIQGLIKFFGWLFDLKEDNITIDMEAREATIRDMPVVANGDFQTFSQQPERLMTLPFGLRDAVERVNHRRVLMPRIPQPNGAEMTDDVKGMQECKKWQEEKDVPEPKQNRLSSIIDI